MNPMAIEIERKNRGGTGWTFVCDHELIAPETLGTRINISTAVKRQKY